MTRTAKYVINARFGGCFRDNVSKLEKWRGSIGTAGITCSCIVALETFLISKLARAKQIWCFTSDSDITVVITVRGPFDRLAEVT